MDLIVFYIDTTLKQQIGYLSTINLSLISNAVVLETLKQCLQVADECGSKYIQVTYDLGIAKLAFKLQSTYKPRFDLVFIHLGTFHVEMAYFKVMGILINNCGIGNVLGDSGL